MVFTAFSNVKAFQGSISSAFHFVEIDEIILKQSSTACGLYQVLATTSGRLEYYTHYDKTSA